MLLFRRSLYVCCYARFSLYDLRCHAVIDYIRLRLFFFAAACCYQKTCYAIRFVSAYATLLRQRILRHYAAFVSLR